MLFGLLSLASLSCVALASDSRPPSDLVPLTTGHSAANGADTKTIARDWHTACGCDLACKPFVRAVSSQGDVGAHNPSRASFLPTGGGDKLLTTLLLPSTDNVLILSEPTLLQLQVSPNQSQSQSQSVSGQEYGLDSIDFLLEVWVGEGGSGVPYTTMTSLDLSNETCAQESIHQLPSVTKITGVNQTHEVITMRVLAQVSYTPCGEKDLAPLVSGDAASSDSDTDVGVRLRRLVVSRSVGGEQRQRQGPSVRSVSDSGVYTYRRLDVEPEDGDRDTVGTITLLCASLVSLCVVALIAWGVFEVRRGRQPPTSGTPNGETRTAPTVPPARFFPSKSIHTVVQHDWDEQNRAKTV